MRILLRRSRNFVQYPNIGKRMMRGGNGEDVAARAQKRDLTDEQNDRLRPIVAKLLDEEKSRGGTQGSLGRKLGISQSALSGFLSRRQGSRYSVVVAACKLAGVDPRTVLGEDSVVVLTPAGIEELERRIDGLRAADVPVGTFLMKLRRLPGLERWIEANPSALTVAQLARGMAIYDDVQPASRSDGQPLNGWGAFFDDALSGRLTRPLDGNQTAAETLELRQLSKATQRKLRSARKNS